MDTATSPLCHDHQSRTKAPRLCRVCQRLAVEHDIVLRAIDGLLAAGYALRTDLLDDPRPSAPTLDRTAIVSEMMAVDDEFLGAFESVTDEKPTGWIRFVYGNDGYDVISDYTTNLEDVLKPVNDYAESLC